MDMYLTHLRLYDLHMHDNRFDWLGICFCISNTSDAWLNRAGGDRKPKKSMMTIVEEVSVFSGKIKQRWSWTQGRYIGMGCCGISI